MSLGLVTPAEAGLITPSGLTSIPAGMETPDAIELRKKIEDSMDAGGGDTPALYQVIWCIRLIMHHVILHNVPALAGL